MFALAAAPAPLEGDTQDGWRHDANGAASAASVRQDAKGAASAAGVRTELLVRGNVVDAVMRPRQDDVPPHQRFHKSGVAGVQVAPAVELVGPALAQSQASEQQAPVRAWRPSAPVSGEHDGVCFGTASGTYRAEKKYISTRKVLPSKCSSSWAGVDAASRAPRK